MMSICCKYYVLTVWVLVISFTSSVATFVDEQPTRGGGGWRSVNNSSISVQDQVNALLSDMYKPVLFPKGEKHVVFDVNPDIQYKGQDFADFYIHSSMRMKNRGNPLVAVIQEPQISRKDEYLLMAIRRNQIFDVFNKDHREIANRLVKIFLERRTVEEVLSLAAYLRDRINTELFVYGFSIVLLMDRKFANIAVPNLLDTMPRKFIDADTMNIITEQVNNHIQAGSTEPIEVEVPEQYTATDLEPEQRLAYFREDIALNMHHWHWHLIYSPIEVVGQKDRRGELNFYMHQQMLARYDFERLSHKMGRVRALKLEEPVVEGYFPKLKGPEGGKDWAGRPVGMTLSDIYRVTTREASPHKIDILDLARRNDRILDSVHRKNALALDGTIVSLDNIQGIDILGDVVEAAHISINRDYYGDLHNDGHDAIAHIHDPDGRFMEGMAVMGDVATAIRDPIFYRWHTYIDHIFKQHKLTLPSYTFDELGFPGVTLDSLSVTTRGASDVNKFHTFFEKTMVEMNVGFSLINNIDVKANITRLQNMPFDYSFEVVNENPSSARGTVRIFLLPTSSEHGDRYPLNEQRYVAIEMDRFNVQLNANERKTFTRDSFASSVTMPDTYTSNGKNNTDLENHCGCGWPQHMLVPKGNVQGLPGMLFAMITNTDDEEVEQPAVPYAERCEAAAYCGLYGQKYPTSLPMGFPFDRKVDEHNVQFLEEFVELYPNLAMQNVSIQFSEERVTTYPSSQLIRHYSRQSDESSENNKQQPRNIVEKFRKDNKLRGNYSMSFDRACWKNRADVIEALLDLGVSVDSSANQYRETCLHYAARQNHVTLAKMLLKKGAKLDARDRHRQTPLMDAVLKSNFEVAQLLIEQGADLQAKDEDGYTALRLARKHGLTKAAQFLVAKGADD